MANFRGVAEALIVSKTIAKIRVSNLRDLDVEGQPWEGADAEFYLWYYPHLQNARIASQETLQNSLWVSMCEKALEHRPGSPRDPAGLELVLNTATYSALQISTLALIPVTATES
jgi:hypothetical protein